MTQYTAYTIDAAPARSRCKVENTKKAFGFAPRLQAHMSKSPELIEWQALAARAA